MLSKVVRLVEPQSSDELADLVKQLSGEITNDGKSIKIILSLPIDRYLDFMHKNGQNYPWLLENIKCADKSEVILELAFTVKVVCEIQSSKEYKKDVS